MKKTALLVVDVQTALLEAHPYDETTVFENIKNVITICRAENIDVIYIRHDGGIGDELENNTRGWNIYEGIAPTGDEKIFDKQYNSAFKETGLKDYLDAKSIKTLIIVGMQTEYCIDTTCKVAFEYGYDLIIPERTTTTFDNIFMTGKEMYDFYMNKIWNDRFAKIITVKQLADMLPMHTEDEIV